jgi:hypothetical protein
MFFCWLSGLVIIMTCVPSMAQRRPISIPGIFSVIRFQNTACVGDNEEGGTCLYEVFNNYKSKYRTQPLFS